jgi:photosystem II stability/assembly factor-like uncharacterized protein
MKAFRFFSFYLALTLIVVSMTECSRTHCRKKDDPIPDPISSEIVNWTSKSNSITSNLVHDYFTSDNIGYICGAGGVIYKTTDGGTSFTLLNSGTTQSLYDVFFTDANTGYVIGDGNTILKTTDAGATWNPLPAPNSTNYRRVFFLDTNTGFIVGGVGTILKTTNAGASWTVLNSGTSVGLYSIYFTDANTGFAAGQYFTMLKTIDGGSSWSVVNTTVTGGNSVTPFLDIYFTNASTGYAVGGYHYPSGTPTTNAIIIKTTDGGASWVQQSNPGGTNEFSGIKFFDSKIGYAVGGSWANNTSLIVKTTDGGSTWSIQTTSSYLLCGLFIVKSGVGYSVGFNGAVLKGNL